MEKSGATLSVLSALARLEIDPWEEAAALALLPKDQASGRLNSLLAKLPEAQAVFVERDALCQRSVDLLPIPNASGAKPDPLVPAAIGALTWSNMLLILITMIVFGMVGSLISPQTSPADVSPHGVVAPSSSRAAADAAAATSK
jgi:hypothetical protein